MESLNIKGSWISWLNRLPGSRLVIGACSVFLLVSCGSEGDSSNPPPSNKTFSSSKPVGSTSLSHGGPAPLSRQKGVGSEDFRIGQRAMVRSQAGDQDATPLPLLAAPPGISGAESPIGDIRKATVLSGTLVTVVGVRPNPTYSITSQSKTPTGNSDSFFEVELEDGVRGWLPEAYLAFQDSTQKEL